MPTDARTRYLPDHLAGSVAALQLMETLAGHERGLQERMAAARAAFGGGGGSSGLDSGGGSGDSGDWGA